MRVIFSTKERKLILDSIDDSGISDQLQKTELRAGRFIIECSSDSLELLINSLAAEANHTQSAARQRALDVLTERLEDIQETDHTKVENTLDCVEVSKTVRVFLNTIRSEDPEVRSKLDFGFRLHAQSIELLEIRPKLRMPGKTEHAFAKATFVKLRGLWKVYWMRGNLMWHPYEPPTVRSLNDFLEAVKKDEHHCFFG